MPAQRGEEESSQWSSGQPAKKRYAKGDRTAKACDACSGRKTRCIPLDPAVSLLPCKFCTNRNLVCTVDSNSRRNSLVSSTGPSRKHSLITPLVSPSIETAASGGAPPPPLAEPNLGIFDPLQHAHTGLNNNAASMFLNHTTNMPPPTTPFAAPFQSPPATYSAPVPIASPVGISASPLYASPLGSSSGSSLPGAGRARAGTGLTENMDHSVSGSTLTRFERPATSALKEPHIPGIIDGEKSMRYFDAYFNEAEFIYQLWPMPHIILDIHEAVWAAELNNHGICNVPLGGKTVLAALLALGAIFERQLDDSEKLYEAARLSYMDVIELSTLESVQLAMQMAVFQINSNRSKALGNSIAVAVRLSHSLNLHRKPALEGKSSQEALRRCQLWYTAFVHDCWLSLSSGRPCLASDGDCDLDPPWLPVQPDSPRLVSSTMFAMRVRLSCIWIRVHEALYRKHGTEAGGSNWLDNIPILEDEFRNWSHDMLTMSAEIDLSHADKMQYQTVLAAYGLMRLIMHRSFLIQRGSQEPKELFYQQRLRSEAAVLDSALAVIDSCAQLMNLGVSLHFWFIGVDLQISCLALCEYIQNASHTATSGGTQRPREALQQATSLLEGILRSGDNPAAGQVLEAVINIQQAWLIPSGPFAPPIGQQLLPSLAPLVQPPASVPSSTIPATDANGFLEAPLFGDQAWLPGFPNANIFDGFVTSSAPNTQNLAWWLNPYHS